MQNPDVVAWLRGGPHGIREFNRWREQHPEIDVLKSLDLSGATLSFLTQGTRLTPNFKGLALENVDFSGADLREAVFYECKLTRVRLTGANLHGARFWDSEVFGSDFQPILASESIEHDRQFVGAHAEVLRSKFNWCNFSRAQLGHMIVKESRFNHCEFGGAWIWSSSFSEVEFSECMFKRTSFRGSTFQSGRWVSCEARWTRLYDAKLHGLDLDRVRHLRFDGNDLRDIRLRMPSSVWVGWWELRKYRTKKQLIKEWFRLLVWHFKANYSEAWHGLRQQYTGAMMLFNLLLLLGGLSGYIIRTLVWIMVDRVEEAAARVGERISEASKHVAASDAAVARVLGAMGSELSSHASQVASHGKHYRVIELVLGFNTGFGLAMLTVVLIVYNVMRGWVTYRVSLLREESDRSGYAPMWREYRVAYRVHLVLKYLQAIAFLSLICHVVYWLSQEVWVPDFR